MAETFTRDRLQPSLLERLTDHEPANQKESVHNRVMTLAQLRQSVVEHLTNLLNTKAPREEDRVCQYEQTAKSVLNYGIHDITGVVTSSYLPSQICRMIAEAIEYFEPRILPETLHVQWNQEDSADSISSLSFDIHCQMWAEPVPDHLYLRTELNLEEGRCQIKRG